MKRKGTFLFAGIMIVIILAFVSCEKYDLNIEGDVEIYLLDLFQSEIESLAILSDGLTLSTEPIIHYDEIVEYNSRTHNFSLTKSAAERIDGEFGSAFALTVNQEIIYTGYFWSDLSSATVDWVVANLTSIQGLDKYEFRVQIGYPWLFEEWSIPDNRNDRRILSVFARDKKLKD